MTLKDKLLVCLEMNEGSGTTVVNSSGIGPNGTLAGGPTWALPGKVGAAAIDLNGTTDYIEIPNHPSLSPTAITVALWVRPVSWSTNFASVASKSEASSPWPSWDFRKPSGAATIQAFVQCGTSATPTAVSPSDVTTGEWQHVAFTFDRTKLIVYRNGVAGTPTTVGASDLAAGSTDLWIGGNPGSPVGRYFDGKVDQFAMWGRALSAGEIAEIYNGGDGLPLAQWDNVSSTLLALDAEYHIGLVADSSGAAAANTAKLNDALENMWPGGAFQFAHGGQGPILVPIHFAGKQFWFDGTIRTSTRSGGTLIGTGRQAPLGNGEYTISGIGGQQTQFIQANPDSDPDSVFLLVRNSGFQFKNIYLYGRHLPTNIHSGTGDLHGVGIALEGRVQPPTGRHTFENFAVVNCEVGIKFLAGFYDGEGLEPDENHADTSLFESGQLVDCPIGIQSWNQQAITHVFRSMVIACPEDGVALDVHRGGLLTFHDLLLGYNDITLLKVYDFSPNNSRFDIHFWRDGFGGETQRLTLFEYAGGSPASWRDWDCRFRGNFGTDVNALAATDIVRFNGLESYPEAISKIWFDFNNMEHITPPTGLAWEVSGNGPWRRLVAI